MTYDRERLADALIWRHIPFSVATWTFVIVGSVLADVVYAALIALAVLFVGGWTHGNLTRKLSDPATGVMVTDRNLYQNTGCPLVAGCCGFWLIEWLGLLFTAYRFANIYGWIVALLSVIVWRLVTGFLERRPTL